MKRILTLCLALCMALALAGVAGVTNPPSARADGTLEVVDLKVEPASLPSAGGTVTLTGKLRNATGASISSVTLSVGTRELEISETIADGASRSFTFSGVPVSGGDIGREMMLVVDYAGEGGVAGSNTASFSVALAAQTVSLSFTRTASNRSVQKGDAVTLTYNLKNTGTAAITNLQLTDSCIDGVILANLTLNAGESKTVTSTVVVNQAIESVPKVVYTAADSTRTKSLEAMKISIANAELSVTATANSTEINAGDSVTFTITIQNDSAVAVKGIKVTDDLGTIIRPSVNIAATTGSSPRTLTLTYETTLTTGRAVSFTIAYPSGNETAVKTTAPIVVNVIGLVPGVSPLTLTVSASPVAMSFPGSVTFSVTVRNTSGQTISQISVASVEPVGGVGSIVSLAPGGQQTLTKSATLTAAGAYAFTATGSDIAGNAIEAATATVSVTDQVGSPTPEVIDPSETDTLSTLFIVMIVIVVLIVLAGVTLIVLVIQERRSKQRGGAPRRRGRDTDWGDGDGDPLLGPIDEPEAPHVPEDAQQQREAMEHTQPILRSALTPGVEDGGDAPADEKPPVRLRYENEDDDLPPFRPRRRR